MARGDRFWKLRDTHYRSLLVGVSRCLTRAPSRTKPELISTVAASLLASGQPYGLSTSACCRPPLWRELPLRTCSGMAASPASGSRRIPVNGGYGGFSYFALVPWQEFQSNHLRAPKGLVSIATDKLARRMQGCVIERASCRFSRGRAWYRASAVTLWIPSPFFRLGIGNDAAR